MILCACGKYGYDRGLWLILTHEPSRASQQTRWSGDVRNIDESTIPPTCHNELRAQMFPHAKETKR
jgi:hypothetical protein